MIVAMKMAIFPTTQIQRRPDSFRAGADGIVNLARAIGITNGGWIVGIMLALGVVSAYMYDVYKDSFETQFEWRSETSIAVAGMMAVLGAVSWAVTSVPVRSPAFMNFFMVVFSSLTASYGLYY